MGGLLSNEVLKKIWAEEDRGLKGDSKVAHHGVTFVWNYIHFPQQPFRFWSEAHRSNDTTEASCRIARCTAKCGKLFTDGSTAVGKEHCQSRCSAIGYRQHVHSYA